MPAAAIGFRALVVTQALSAFNNNLLRSALLTLVAFRPVERAGMTSETVVALSTLFIVAPYAVLSIPGGRLADARPKASLIRKIKAFEIIVFAIAAAGLLLMNVPLLLLALLLAGTEAALFGPAKFGILPEIVPADRLVAANSWVSATGTLAILAGLIAGNLLVLEPFGLEAVAGAGMLLAALGWILTLFIPVTPASAPGLGLQPRLFLSDFWVCFGRLVTVPVLILPVLGCSWFWFQGAANTSLVPLYVAQGPSLPETIVSLLLVSTSLGVGAGALAARWLTAQKLPPLLPVLALLVTALPGIDLWIAGPIHDGPDTFRAAFDFFTLGAGCGLYVVPLTAAVQKLTPAEERARFVGVNHTLNGVAMICAGFAMLFLNLPFVSVTGIFAVSGIVSGGLAAVTLIAVMPALRPIPPEPRKPGAATPA